MSDEQDNQRKVKEGEYIPAGEEIKEEKSLVKKRGLFARTLEVTTGVLSPSTNKNLTHRRKLETELREQETRLNEATIKFNRSARKWDTLHKVIENDALQVETDLDRQRISRIEAKEELDAQITINKMKELKREIELEKLQQELDSLEKAKQKNNKPPKKKPKPKSYTDKLNERTAARREIEGWREKEIQELKKQAEIAKWSKEKIEYETDIANGNANAQLREIGIHDDD